MAKMVGKRGKQDSPLNPGVIRSFIVRSIVAFAIIIALFGVETAHQNAGVSKISAQIQGICDRTLEVQLSIEDWLSSQGRACEDYTTAHLESLTGF